MITVTTLEPTPEQVIDLFHRMRLDQQNYAPDSESLLWLRAQLIDWLHQFVVKQETQ